MRSRPCPRSATRLVAGTVAATTIGALWLVGAPPGNALTRPATSVTSVTSVTPAAARTAASGKVPVMVGAGGAVASVDQTASQVGIDVLRSGGNAADAAVAMAGALGVTEPFSSGIGGGGFFVYYDAKSHRVSTIDGRESAPKAFTPTVFTDGQGNALDFNTVVTSGLSVGVPGTLALWDTAARRYGTRSLSADLAPGQRVATQGFPVDATFAQQVSDNAARFEKFPATAALYLPGGSPPAVGTTFRNPDLAATYDSIRHRGVSYFYDGSARGRNRVGSAPAADRPRRQRLSRTGDQG